MILIIDKFGYILNIQEIKEITWKLETNIQIKEILKGKYFFDEVIINLNKNKINFLAIPGNYKGNVFCAYRKEEIIISDNFFEICKELEEVNFNLEAEKHFIKTSSMPTGTTWVKEVETLISHKVYFFKSKKFISESIEFQKYTLTKEELYEKFKLELNKTIKRYEKGKHALLLSGGADSRLLALLMKENNLDFETYTVRSFPYADSALQDVEIAKEISKELNVKNNIVDIDFRKLKVEDLDLIIENMPNTSHVSLGFLSLIKEASNNGCNKIWCGQNADNLYNLGPSGKVSFSFIGIMNLYKRFYLCEEYFNYLQNKKNLMYGLIAFIGNFIYSFLKKEKTFLPNDLLSLIDNYKNSYDYTVFSTDKKENFSKIIEVEKVKQKLFKYKVENYLKSGPSQVIDVASSLYNIKDFILPYSSENMLSVFSNIKLNFKNILKPKEYIYIYIKELSLKYNKKITKYDYISKKDLLEKYQNIEDIHSSYMSIMTKTNFGKELSNLTLQNKPKGYTGVQYLQTCLNYYWKLKVIKILKEKYKVKINN